MRDFDKAAGQLPEANRPKLQPKAIATPAPVPAPAGIPQPRARTVQNVPHVDQAAAWAKTEQGRAEIAKHQPVVPVRPQFERNAATPPESLSCRAMAKRNHIHNWNKIFAGQTVVLDGLKKVARQNKVGLMPRPSDQQARAPEQARTLTTPQQPTSPQTRSGYWGERLKAKAAEMSRDQKRDQGQKRNQDQEPSM